MQAAWYLKGRGLTEQTYVDEVEMEEEGYADVASEPHPLLHCMQYAVESHGNHLT